MITAACSVGPHWILDSLVLVAWFKEGHNELRLVKVGATGWWVVSQEPSESSWAEALIQSVSWILLVVDNR